MKDSQKSKYRVVDVQGQTTDPGGMIVTLEDKYRRNVKTKKKKSRVAQNGVIALIVLVAFFSVFILGGIISLVGEKMSKNGAQNTPEIKINAVATTQSEVIGVGIGNALAEISDNFEIVSFYREDIPLSYDLQEKLYNAATEFGIPYELALAVVWRETRFENIYGDGGNAYGYFQIWPKWHGDRATKLGVYDLMDAEGNFRVGCSILSDLLKNYGGDMHKALMSYNMGAGGADKLWRQGVTTSKYSRAVVDYMEGLV